MHNSWLDTGQEIKKCKYLNMIVIIVDTVYSSKNKMIMPFKIHYILMV